MKRRTLSRDSAFDRGSDLAKKTLFMNTWSSRCGNCDRGCSPDTETHETVVDYPPLGGTPGCGVRWEYLSSDYFWPDGGEGLRARRPDLKWLNNTMGYLTESEGDG